MIERTEEQGLAARLTIAVGGKLVQLRTLNLDESDEWQGKLAFSVADFDIPSEPTELFPMLIRQPARVMLELVVAYDVDKQLPSNLRKLFTQVELYAAVKQMVTAELPFAMDARSVVEEFGPQLRAMATGVVFQALGQLQQGSFTSSPSPTGDSTPEPSADSSPTNGSSSSGPTDSDASNGSPKRPPSKPKSPPPMLISTQP